MTPTFLEQKFEEVKTIEDFKKVVIEILQEVFNNINDNECRIDDNECEIINNRTRITTLEHK